jgi:hypothetical protein
MDDDHRVLLPRCSCVLVADPTPEIDHLLAPNVGAAGATQLTAPGKVLGKRFAHPFKATTGVSLDRV